MKKYTVKDYILNIIIIAFILIMALAITRGQYYYGSKTDWATQHYNIPDYFRKLFYYNGDLFPQFALELGSGQNIFYYAYYGLFSPVILISYLFAFVSMRTYIMAASIAVLILSAILFYRWIFNKYGTNVAFMSSLLFVAAGPFILHSHRHIMFIDYMPFVILALMGVDNFFKKNKRVLLIMSVVFMILTSFYFSVPGLIGVTIYAIAQWADSNDKLSFKGFLKVGIRYAINIICGIMISAFLLLPTMYALMMGRAENVSDLSLLKVLIPRFHNSLLFYSHYSMGLTAVFAVAVIYFIFFGRRKNRIIAASFAIITYFGIITYVLNAGMYLDGKVFIAMLPIGCYLSASFLWELANKDFPVKKLILFTCICNIPVLIIPNKTDLAFLLDVAITMICIYIYKKKNIKWIFNIVITAVAVCICIILNLADNLVPVDSDYLVKEEDYAAAVNNIIKNEDSLYRVSQSNMEYVNRVFSIGQSNVSSYSSTYNLLYGNFYFNEIYNEDSYRNSAIISSSQNLIFNMYIGNRYYIGESCDLKGYDLTDYGHGEISVYENEDVRSVGYVTNKVLSQDAYEQLEYPYNVAALYGYAVSENFDEHNAILPEIKKWEFGTLEEFDTAEILERDKEDTYIVKNISEDDEDDRVYERITIPVPEELQDKVFFVKLEVDSDDYLKDNESGSYKNKDVVIDVNGVRNKLTDPNWKYYNNNVSFEYTIASNEKVDNICIDFSDGIYRISELSIYTMDYGDITGMSDGEDEFIIDSYNKNGNVLSGKVDCSASGCFVLTLPYDEGFQIYVDGKKTDYFLTDTAFIGFGIDKGEHTVTVKYQAPLFREGMIISVAGILIFIVLISYDVIKVYFLKKVL